MKIISVILKFFMVETWQSMECLVPRWNLKPGTFSMQVCSYVEHYHCQDAELVIQ
jgi:hypothetical protein